VVSETAETTLLVNKLTELYYHVVPRSPL